MNMSVTVSGIKNYIKTLRKLMADNENAYLFYSWVLQNGRGFSKQNIELTEKIVLKYGPSTKAKQCFYNAQLLVLDNPDIKYYEGWFISQKVPIPIEHGFNVVKGQVVDVTRFGEQIDNVYFGVHIPTSFIRKHMLESGMAKQILQMYYYEKVG